MKQPSKGLLVSIGLGMVMAGAFLTWSGPESSHPLAPDVGRSGQPAHGTTALPPWSEDSAGRPGVHVGMIHGHPNAESGWVEPQIGQALRVHLDPATGAILQEPPQPRPGSSPLPQASTSAQGLRELPGTTRAGGVKVDLGDRFFHFTTVTLDPQGRAQGQCLQNPASPSALSTPAASSP